MRLSRRLRIIIPACNEAGRIEPTVRQYCARFATEAVILVVANGCTDNTVSIVRAMQDRYANLELIEIAGRIGKGGAVRAGLWIGLEEFVAFVDADGSTSADEFARLYQLLDRSDDDAIIGSRWLRGARIEQRQPLTRRIASRGFNVIVRSLFGLPYSDTQCGAKLFRRRAIDEILHSLEVANFAFDIEVLWRLRRRGFVVREEPTVWSDREFGTTIRLASSSWGMLKSILRLRLRESGLWLLPFMDRFARASVIPVVERHRVLFLGGLIADVRSTVPRYAAFFDALGSMGYRVTDVESEISSSWLRKLCKRRDILGTASTIIWYVVYSHRDHDAIVELAQPRMSWIPTFSLKPSLLLTDAKNPATSKHRSRYIRTALLNLDEIDPAQAAATLAIVQSGASPYAGVFFGWENAISLNCPSQSGWQRHLLRR